MSGDAGSWTDGEWTAMTLGTFVGIMIDSQERDAVLVQVVEDKELSHHSFSRELRVLMVPNGHITEQMREKGVDRVHKVLASYLKGGVLR